MSRVKSVHQCVACVYDIELQLQLHSNFFVQPFFVCDFSFSPCAVFPLSLSFNWRWISFTLFVTFCVSDQMCPQYIFTLGTSFSVIYPELWYHRKCTRRGRGNCESWERERGREREAEMDGRKMKKLCSCELKVDQLMVQNKHRTRGASAFWRERERNTKNYWIFFTLWSQSTGCGTQKVVCICLDRQKEGEKKNKRKNINEITKILTRKPFVLLICISFQLLTHWHLANTNFTLVRSAI